MSGNHLVARDLNDNSESGEPAYPDQVTVIWANLSLGGPADQCLLFSGLFAAARDGVNGEDGIDSGDFVKVDYSLSGGAFIDLLHFQGGNFTDPTAFANQNGLFFPDLDFDGKGDENEPALAAAAAEYTATSSSLRNAQEVTLRLTIHIDGDDVGLDDFDLSLVSCGPVIASCCTARPKYSIPTFPLPLYIGDIEPPVMSPDTGDSWNIHQ
eukprot:TRINITY_DN12644_c1_g1_i1.p1 TRINITY_DN12644_c1_g1~~TRINITY_DN12644_c1_g1_i1.p1  ORF type:complete len:211 (+),score=53.71 TRINITY_DN12644_c1_g1_i1:345-977(+)